MHKPRLPVLSLLLMLICLPVTAQSYTPFQMAVIEGDTARLKSLLESDPSLANAKDENGVTPIFWAIAVKKIEVARVLIDHKADVDARGEQGMSPLHMCVMLDIKDMAEMLLDKGANVNSRNDYGQTPLHLAMMFHKPEMASLLRSKGADVNAKDNTGATPAGVQKQMDGYLAEGDSGRPERSAAGNEALHPRRARPAADRRPGAPGTKAVTYAQKSVLGCPVNVITADLNDSRVRVTAAVTSGGIGTDEPFASFIQRTKPTAAINGTFFSKGDLRPIGDIVVGGQLVHFGAMGSGICLTDDQQAQIVSVVRHSHTDWSDFETVMCCGPRLLKSGTVCVDAASEGFRDPHVLGRANRTGVGVTAGNKLIVANTRKGVTLSEWANVMRALGCVDAINLDGGASMAMYYRGKTISQAGRRLTNVLLVYER